MRIRLATMTDTHDEFDHEMVWGTISLLVLLAARFFPLGTAPMPACVFLAITGLPCPSCGMTRCFMAMSRLDFWTAWRMNPLGTALFVAMVCYAVYALIVVVGRLPRVRIEFASVWELRALLAAAVLLFAVNWAYLLVMGNG